MKRVLATAALPALVALLATALGGPAGTPVHDAIAGLRPGAPVPVQAALVVVDPATPEAAARAVQAARDAGATRVVAALPADHPLLGGAAPEPAGFGDGPLLRTWTDDRGERLLSLPDSLDTILRLDGGQLSAGRLLQDQVAVLWFADPAVGIAAAVPGRAAPVDRAEVLALALGSERGLTRLPRWVAAALAAVLVGGVGLALHRRSPPLAMTVSAAGAVVVLVAVVLARGQGLLLPLLGPVAGLLLTGVVQVLRVAGRLDGAVDLLEAQVAGEPEGAGAPGLADLVEMARILVPGAAVAAWDPAGERVHGGGPGSEALQPPRPLPEQPAGSPERVVLPVRRDGRLQGALTVARLPAPTDAERASLLALTQLEHPLAALRVPVVDEPDDPLGRRLARVHAGVGGLAVRSGRLDALLRRGPVRLGLFDLAGRALILGAGLRDWLPDGRAPALLRLVERVGGMARADASMLLQDALAVPPGGPPVVRALTDELAGWELVVQAARLDRASPAEGVVVYLQDVRGHARLASARATALTLASDELAELQQRLRDAVDSGRGSRKGLLSDLDRLGALQAHLAELARTGADADPEIPLPIQRCLSAALQGVPSDVRDRVTVELPECPAVRVRAAVLARSLGELLTDLVRHAGRVHVTGAADTDGVQLLLHEGAGGLPEGMAEALLADDSGAWPAVQARRTLARMGGTLTARPHGDPTAEDAGGTTLVLFLPYF